MSSNLKQALQQNNLEKLLEIRKETHKKQIQESKKESSRLSNR